MLWKIELSDLARKNLSKLDRQVADRIYTFLENKLAKLENPRLIGEALQG
jgi:mRNA interferase RelE/StbE